MSIYRSAAVLLLVCCGLSLLSCSGGPGDAAEYFVREIVKTSGTKLAVCRVIEVGSYDKIQECWPVLVKTKSDSTSSCSTLYLVKVRYDNKEGGWKLKDWDAEVVVD